MRNPIQNPTKLKLPQAEVTPDIMSASGKFVGVKHVVSTRPQSGFGWREMFAAGIRLPSLFAKCIESLPATPTVRFRRREEPLRGDLMDAAVAATPCKCTRFCGRGSGGVETDGMWRNVAKERTRVTTIRDRNGRCSGRSFHKAAKSQQNGERWPESPKHWPLGCSLTGEMKTYFEIGI